MLSLSEVSSILIHESNPRPTPPLHSKMRELSPRSGHRMQALVGKGSDTVSGLHLNYFLLKHHLWAQGDF